LEWQFKDSARQQFCNELLPGSEQHPLQPVCSVPNYPGHLSTHLFPDDIYAETHKFAPDHRIKAILRPNRLRWNSIPCQYRLFDKKYNNQKQAGLELGLDSSTTRFS
jgi:hypothetical protein